MTRPQQRLITAALLVAIAAWFSFASQGLAEKKPNVLFIFTDDQRLYGDTLPLTCDDPIPVAFTPPEKQRVKYRGGLAPEASEE